MISTKKSFAATCRRPVWPASSSPAFTAIAIAGQSAAGSAFASEPPIVAAIAHLRVGNQVCGLMVGWAVSPAKFAADSPVPKSAACTRPRTWGPPISDEQVYRIIDAIDEISAETGKTVTQIALNWLLQRPTVSTVNVGARNEEQLKQNLGPVGWTLTKEQVAKLDAASSVTLPYPYWHQRQFKERNPPPV